MTLSFSERIDLWFYARGIDLVLWWELATYFAVCATYGLVKGLMVGGWITTGRYF